ncbi:MAG: hypothetical protein WAN94_01700 [Pseudolabrys sp.]
MLKVVYLREGPDAAVSSAKYMVEAAAIVIANELGPAETRRFLHFVGVRRGQEHWSCLPMRSLNMIAPSRGIWGMPVSFHSQIT